LEDVVENIGRIKKCHCSGCIRVVTIRSPWDPPLFGGAAGRGGTMGRAEAKQSSVCKKPKRMCGAAPGVGTVDGCGRMDD